MAKVAHYYTKFESLNFYHIYNRTIDKQPMFKTDANCKFFLTKYNEYLSSVVDTYAYCLLGNHFHILLRIRDTKELNSFTNIVDLSTVPATINQEIKTEHDIVTHQFRKFFQSYAMAFNKENDRIGTLFQTPFKRALVDNDAYFTKLIYYIHANPQQHNLIDDFRNWEWSSYKRMLMDRPSQLKKIEVLDWFGGIDNYLQYHEAYYDMLLEDNLLFD